MQITGNDSSVTPTYHERDGYTWLELSLRSRTSGRFEGGITLFMPPEEAVTLAREIYKAVTMKNSTPAPSLEQMTLPPEMVIHVSGEM